MPSTGYYAGFWRAAVALLVVVGGAAAARAEPVTIAIALDTSGSIRKDELQRARNLCGSLLSHLPPGSDAGLITFDDRERLLLPWGSSAEDVRKALAIVGPTGKFTALHDALYEASRKLQDAPAGRKAILLVTDGKDEGSTLTLEDGLRVAQDSRIPIWVVGLGAVQERVLKRIAKLTAGEYVPLASATAEGLAARIMSAPPAHGAPPSSATRSKEASPALDPPPPASEHVGTAASRPSTNTAAPRRVSGQWLAAGVVGLLVAVGLGWMMMHRRGRHECPTCGLELAGPLSRCGACSTETAAAHARLAEARPRTVTPDPMWDVKPAARVGTGTLERKPPLALVNALAKANGTTGPVAARFSETLLQRMNNTEEYLEKTVTLTERPVLVITSGPGSGRVFNLNPEVTTCLGRAKLNDVVVEDIAVSSEHCRIRPDGAGFTLHDLKSTNGTYVNDKKVVAHQALNAGDIITIGETHLLFRMDHQRA